jgi:hypothetical protein
MAYRVAGMEQQVEEVVMESTSQYWKPVWGVLERHWKPMCQRREGAGRMSGTLHLAQALSRKTGPRLSDLPEGLSEPRPEPAQRGSR